MYGLSEADITLAWERIIELRRSLRIAVSPHAYVLYCVARVLNEFPELNSYRRGRRLITFDDVDIGTTVERRLPGTGHRYAAGFVMRSVQAMSLADINWRLRTVTRMDPAEDETAALRRKFARLPGWVRWLLGRQVKADPFRHKRIYGTVGVTSLNIADAERPYHPIPPNPYTMTVATGGLLNRAVPMAGGTVEMRKFLTFTMAVDHALVDGLLAVRAGRALVQMLESAQGLDDDFITQTRRLRQGATG